MACRAVPADPRHRWSEVFAVTPATLLAWTDGSCRQGPVVEGGHPCDALLGGRGGEVEG